MAEANTDKKKKKRKKEDGDGDQKKKRKKEDGDGDGDSTSKKTKSGNAPFKPLGKGTHVNRGTTGGKGKPIKKGAKLAGKLGKAGLGKGSSTADTVVEINKLWGKLNGKSIDDAQAEVCTASISQQRPVCHVATQRL
jgi:hypothetical protein